MACWDKTFDLINWVMFLSVVNMKCSYYEEVLSFLYFFRLARNTIILNVPVVQNVWKYLVRGKKCICKAQKYGTPNAAKSIEGRSVFMLYYFLPHFPHESLTFKRACYRKKSVEVKSCTQKKKKKRNVNFLICLVSLVTFLFCVN